MGADRDGLLELFLRRFEVLVLASDGAPQLVCPRLIDAIKLGHSLTDGRQVATITDPTFDVPTTGALARHSLFVINARFNTPPTPDTTYSITRVDALH